MKQAPQARAKLIWTWGLLIVLAAFGVSAWVAYNVVGSGGLSSVLPSARSGAGEPKTKESDKVFNLICDGTQSIPLDGFDAPAKVVPQTFVAGINLKDKTGWYQGQIAISETRKGTLTINESGEIVVGRPALFERYGAMITGEQFTLNRDTGEFIQSVTLSDKRHIVMIKAYCGKLIKAPF